MRTSVSAQHEDVLLQAAEMFRLSQLLPVGDDDSILCSEHGNCIPTVWDMKDVECQI